MSEEMQPCPKCGEMDDMNWPVTVNSEIVDGGCQNCWEAECSESWWAALPVWCAMGLCEESAE